MRMPPRTPEQEKQTADLMQKVRDATAAFDALPAIDQAVHRMEQKRSFVRGETGCADALLDQPEYVVLDAFLKMRAALAASGDRLVGAPAPQQDRGESATTNDMTADQWRVEHHYKNNTLRICQGDRVIYAGITDSSAWEIVAAHNNAIARYAIVLTAEGQRAIDALFDALQVWFDGGGNEAHRVLNHLHPHLTRFWETQGRRKQAETQP